LRGNIDGLLPVSVAESDKGVEKTSMLVFKDVRQVLKLLHGLVAYGAKRPILFRDVHGFVAHISSRHKG
jgi:hypothetical protein